MIRTGKIKFLVEPKSLIQTWETELSRLIVLD